MNAPASNTLPKIRVMLVDDSTIIRGLISRALTKDPEIEIIATSGNGEDAIPQAKHYKPDIIILDIEMPKMDGITALPLLLQASPNTRVIMASTLTMRNAGISMEAMERGASDYLAKPSAQDRAELENFYRELLEKVKALAASRKATAPAFAASSPLAAAPKTPIVLKPETKFPVQALAIASSTGGPQALTALFTALKGKLTHIPIFITQHMPPTFTTILAQHISKACGRSCTEGVEGEIAQPGHIYIAPGDFHMVPQRLERNIVIHINKEPQVNFCRPAADPMFNSLSKIYGSNLMGLVLTGMGHDGADGAKTIVQNGGAIIAQNEATCVVYGMPKAVADAGVCQAILPLSDIALYLERRCS